MVNVTYNKGDGGITFHILGHDHFESTESDFEDEALVTRELMETSFGRFACCTGYPVLYILHMLYMILIIMYNVCNI